MFLFPETFLYSPINPLQDSVLIVIKFCVSILATKKFSTDIWLVKSKFKTTNSGKNDCIMSN